MSSSASLEEALQFIDPSSCNYEEWCNVGMALKYEGYPVTVWADWSRRDPARYHEGECEKKWLSFNGGSHESVTAGTIILMAKRNGWTPSPSGTGKSLEWDDTINDDKVIIDRAWIESRKIPLPVVWNPVQQLITYLETLFDSSEYVRYVVKSYLKDGEKYVPKDAGNYDRTAGQLIEALTHCNGDMGAVIGDYDPEGGAWIQFNPMDGKGTMDKNVTDYRYSLVESDDVDLETQYAILHELELPIAALVYSGGKSIHAIVRVDAMDLTEYRKKVDYLYDVCKKNGLKIDPQNRNPSRLSRMPGIIRKREKQYLIETNIGKTSWAEWYEWIEGVNDDLPDVENFSSFWDQLPELSPPLIDGILRQGHKMLLAGPSKAGKSYALVELCIAFAEGTKWLGFKCAQGKVLYINLEVDRASCLHRFKDVYTAMRLDPNNIDNIDIWNLRGKAVPMDKLAPKIIRRAAKKGYIAIIIDPIYKIITGDENSAEQMSHFCNQFDRVCNELGCAVIYCHHHSKGAQGDKRSMDRASGSGVFARDPDAMLDLIELEITEDLQKQQENEITRLECLKWLDRYVPDWEDDVSQDDILSASKMQKYAEKRLSGKSFEHLKEDIDKGVKASKSYTAWRIEGTLREFPKIQPLNVWFRYPIHVEDTNGVLQDLQAETTKGSPYNKNFSKKKTNAERKKDRRSSLITAFSAAAENGVAKLSEVAEYLGVEQKTVKNYVKESGDLFTIDNGLMIEKQVEKVDKK